MAVRLGTFPAEFALQAGTHKDQTDMAPYVSLRDLRRFRITLPQPEEQRRIAGVLGALDDLIDTNSRLIQSSTAVAALVFRQLADNATKFVAFSETVDILSGGTPKTSEPAFWQEGSIPWFLRDLLDTPAEGEARAAPHK